MLLAFLKALLDDRVCSFADNQDPIIRSLYNDGHTLSSTVKLNNIKQLVALFAIPSLAHHIAFIVTTLEHEAKVACTVYQSKLIRRASIVDCVLLLWLLFSFFDVCDYSVAQTECLQEALHTSMIWMLSVLKLSIQILIIKVDIGNTRLVDDTFWVIQAKLMIIDREFLELHYILCQSAGLV